MDIYTLMDHIDRNHNDPNYTPKSDHRMKYKVVTIVTTKYFLSPWAKREYLRNIKS